MEFQPITPPPTLYPPGAPPPTRPSSKKKPIIILSVVGIVAVLVLFGVVLIGGGRGGSSESTANQPLSFIKHIPFIKDIIPGDEGGGDFFMTSLPRPIEDITFTDIPSYFDVLKAVQDGNRLWIASRGFLVEYDAAKKSVIASSDPKKAGACDDVVTAGAFIYTACRNAAGEYSIYKINAKTKDLARAFTARDGLRNVTNVKLFAAADAVWFTTASGVGRLETVSDTLAFFDTELGIEGTAPATGSVIFDGNYVWVVSLATTTSKGGVSVYDKTAKTWKGFGPTQLQERERDKIDIEGIKPIQGGLQIAFRDGRIGGTIRLVEKQYHYATGAWTKISDRPTTGDGGEITYAAMQKDYPQDPVYTTVAGNGLSQLKIPATGQSFPTDGRRNYVLSPVVNGKRYLLTSATVDVIDTTSPFNRILVRLGEGIELHQTFPDPLQYQSLVEFQIDPQSMLGIITDSGCDPRTGCGGAQKAWLVDLKNGRLVRTYTPADGLPGGRLLTDITIRGENGTLDAYNKIGIKLFSIDTTTFHLTPNITPPPAAPTSPH